MNNTRRLELLKGCTIKGGMKKKKNDKDFQPFVN